MEDTENEARTLNLTNWESRVPHHLTGYRIAPLLADPEALSGVVAFDRPRLGDIAGLETVHLQCHIGTDTLSLARLGARVTGLDFSRRRSTPPVTSPPEPVPTSSSSSPMSTTHPTCSAERASTSSTPASGR